MHHLLLKAAEFSLPTDSNDPRAFWLACIGIRNDQRIIIARNGSIQSLFSDGLNPDKMKKSSLYHAEGRALNKMTKGGVLYVARVSRKNGELVQARPCGYCRAKIQSYRIDKVYYTINQTQYGVWFPEENYDRVFNELRR